MATKDQMRQEILDLEPENAIAKSSSAGHAELKKELNAAKRRLTAKQKSTAIPVIVKFRHEQKERMSWKLCRKDTGEPMTGLLYGDELPRTGTIEPVEECIVHIVSHSEGLDILAGDIDAREKFDARRIYVTANNSSVAYKRMENGKVILWSYKIQGEILVGPQMVMTITERNAKPTASIAKKMTQKVLAAYLISENPRITPSELTKSLQEAFPQASIGQRHGPHYLSLSRNGKLPEPPDDDPRTWES